MHIKSIYVEGFKSYAKRTEIVGFDPAFNAITGLNGSGKSNILDSICFVLGISNLSQVRASSLQDLVYKSGQAGITKATVSIIFENKDKLCSPIGYENFDELTITRQIVIGGKNKYLINGITATNTRVQDLFRSVQLNVNNPHFLIMQGRITKVLNMKPPEILSLLEEAASTKLYEVKRADTLKTIEKKDVKLLEIDKILKEDIKPTLAKLKEERSSYLEYQKVVRDLEYLNKFVVAYDYTNKKAIVDNSEGELNRMKEQHDQEEQLILNSNAEKENLENQINEMCAERDNVHIFERDQLERKYSELQKEEAILNNAIKRAEDDLNEAELNIQALERQSQEESEARENIQKEISKIQNQFDQLRNQVKQSTSKYELAQKRLQEVNSGFFVSGSGDATGSLSELLAAAEREESTHEIQLNVLRMKIAHSTKIFKDLETKLRGMKKNESAKQQEIKHQSLKADIADLEQKIVETGFSNEQWEQLQSNRIANSENYRRTNDERYNFIGKNRRFEFQYSRPSPNFDEKKICGMVVSLVRLDKLEFSIALEIAAGSRLFNVVVQDAETVVQLFEGNCLRYRTTLLPLDKMQYSLVPENVLKRARQIVGADNVWSPMDLIKFDQRYYNAIAYVFGGFLIARNLDMAKTVAFNEQIKCRCVTLEGEIFDPEGTLVGGNLPIDTRAFEQAQHLNKLDASLTELRNNKAEIENQTNKLQAAQNCFRSLQNDLRTLQVELRQVERGMMKDDYLEIQKTFTDTKAEMDDLSDQISVAEGLWKTASAKTKEARDNLANSESVKEQAQKTAQTNLRVAQEEMKHSEDAFKDIEFRYETLTLELNDNEEEKENFHNSLKSARERETEKDNELQIKKAEFLSHGDELKQFKAKLDEKKNAIKKINIDINKATARVQENIKIKDQAALKLSDIVHRISCHKKDSEDAEIKLAKMVRKHVWIAEESKHFNQPGSIYDFAKRDYREALQNIDKLDDQKRKLSRKVDLRGMNMLGQAEERYNDLMSKYQKVLQDKSKLQTVIDELDKLKDEEIKKAHKQVDRDFHNIFSTLLPGSQARLIPPEGKSLSDGLEFKIAFGNVWKESLNELSGGQRSLVALSLILALLRFKPAPLYILDEVDAALDISHTNNIGTLIKEQFSNSQFIIVSLKDGMFNNANVLFKTKFVDGVSTVTRHVNAARRPMTEKNN